MYATSVAAVHPVAAVPEKNQTDNTSMLGGVRVPWPKTNGVRQKSRGVG